MEYREKLIQTLDSVDKDNIISFDVNETIKNIDAKKDKCKSLTRELAVSLLEVLPPKKYIRYIFDEAKVDSLTVSYQVVHQEKKHTISVIFTDEQVLNSILEKTEVESWDPEITIAFKIDDNDLATKYRLVNDKKIQPNIHELIKNPTITEAKTYATSHAGVRDYYTSSSIDRSEFGQVSELTVNQYLKKSLEDLNTKICKEMNRLLLISSSNLDEINQQLLKIISENIE